MRRNWRISVSKTGFIVLWIGVACFIIPYIIFWLSNVTMSPHLVPIVDACKTLIIVGGVLYLAPHTVLWRESGTPPETNQ